MKLTSQPDDGYDGPTINGRPILGIETVQHWFNDAYRVCPPAEFAVSIAQSLNHCALFEAQWKNTPEFKAARRRNPSTLRMQRICDALNILHTNVQILVDGTRKDFPNSERDGRFLPYIGLLDSVNLLFPAFQKFTRRGRGREPEAWHRIARNLAPMVIQAAKGAGVRRVGFGKVTSPAVGIMQSALGFLGVCVSEQAIVDAMRKRSKRVGKTAA